MDIMIFFGNKNSPKGTYSNIMIFNSRFKNLWLLLLSHHNNLLDLCVRSRIVIVQVNVLLCVTQSCCFAEFFNYAVQCDCSDGKQKVKSKYTRN